MFLRLHVIGILYAFFCKLLFSPSTLYLWAASILICVTLICSFSLFNIQLYEGVTVYLSIQLFLDIWSFSRTHHSYHLLIFLLGCLSFPYWFVSILFFIFWKVFFNKQITLTSLLKLHKTYHSFAFPVLLELYTAVHVWKGSFNIPLPDWCQLYPWNCLSVNMSVIVDMDIFLYIK